MTVRRPVRCERTELHSHHGTRSSEARAPRALSADDWLHRAATDRRGVDNLAGRAPQPGAILVLQRRWGRPYDPAVLSGQQARRLGEGHAQKLQTGGGGRDRRVRRQPRSRGLPARGCGRRRTAGLWRQRVRAHRPRDGGEPGGGPAASGRVPGRVRVQDDAGHAACARGCRRRQRGGWRDRSRLCARRHRRRGVPRVAGSIAGDRPSRRPQLLHHSRPLRSTARPRPLHARRVHHKGRRQFGPVLQQ